MNRHPFFVLLLAALLLAGFFVYLYYSRRVLRREREENRRLREILRFSANSAQADLEELRRLRHDLRHYLLASKMAAEGTGAEEAVPEQRTMAGPVQNWVLSTLEDYYCQRARGLGAQVDLRLDLALAGEEMLPDLCLLLSNLLENAVEALQKEGGGWLRARSISAPGYLTLVVGNSCSTTLRLRSSRYLSSKREGRLGVGLATVEEIARQHGGSAEFSADGKEFRAAVFLTYPLQQEKPACPEDVSTAK